MVLPGVWDTLSFDGKKWMAEFGVQWQIIIIIIIPFDGASACVRYVVPWCEQMNSWIWCTVTIIIIIIIINNNTVWWCYRVCELRCPMKRRNE